MFIQCREVKNDRAVSRIFNVVLSNKNVICLAEVGGLKIYCISFVRFAPVVLPDKFEKYLKFNHELNENAFAPQSKDYLRLVSGNTRALFPPESIFPVSVKWLAVLLRRSKQTRGSTVGVAVLVFMLEKQVETVL